ncbi:hypothetical protein HaLaN_17018 [Haematococcus lacustris]|uniref:Uncharacterized protein n=1 Tax=Haematococcus lacustris TaxID=44745 RepID=A0A699ZDS2_HAELA|nr:hypothetical protein HaLaN_17018 [Haematococcus lacustris]
MEVGQNPSTATMGQVDGPPHARTSHGRTGPLGFADANEEAGLSWAAVRADGFSNSWGESCNSAGISSWLSSTVKLGWGVWSGVHFTAASLPHGVEKAWQAQASAQ